MLMYGKCECFIMQILYVCVHAVAIINAAFCSLLKLVRYAIGHHHVVSSSYLLPSLYACLSCIVEL